MFKIFFIKISDKRGYVSFNSLLLSVIKTYYDELGLFKNLSDQGINELEEKEKEFFVNLNKVLKIIYFSKN